MPTSTRLCLTCAVTTGVVLMSLGAGGSSRAHAAPQQPPPATIVTSVASANPTSSSASSRAITPSTTAIGLPAIAYLPCPRSSLRLGPDGPPSEATGEASVYLALTNVSDRACHIRAYPTVTLFDAYGRPLPFRYRHGHDAEYVTDTPPTTVSLWPGGRASFEIAKYRCDSGDGVRATTVEIRLGAGGRPFFGDLRSQRADVSYCRGGPNDPGQIVNVSPVEPDAGVAF